jgi:hypothetical protein
MTIWASISCTLQDLHCNFVLLQGRCTSEEAWVVLMSVTKGRAVFLPETDISHTQIDALFSTGDTGYCEVFKEIGQKFGPISLRYILLNMVLYPMVHFA